MAVLLFLAVAGGVIRYQAPNPSTLRDIGSLLLVLWLPAVGNLIGYFLRKLPAPKPPPLAFAPEAPFSAQLLARIDSVTLPPGWLGTLDPTEQRCVALVGRRGFTVRSAQPLAQWLAQPPQTLALECLVPDTALRQLVPGTAFHLLVGSTAVARGQVLERIGPATDAQEANAPA